MKSDIYFTEGIKKNRWDGHRADAEWNTTTDINNTYIAYLKEKNFVILTFITLIPYAVLELVYCALACCEKQLKRLAK